MKACRWRRGIAPLILNFNTRLEFLIDATIALSPGKNAQYPLNTRTDRLHMSKLMIPILIGNLMTHF